MVQLRTVFFYTEIQRNRNTERQKYRETEIQIDRNTERQKYRQTEIQRDRTTERQKYRETEIQRETEKERAAKGKETELTNLIDKLQNGFKLLKKSNKSTI